jgi:addiction module HigA family antidote
MPMKNPPHPGAGLKDDIAALGLTISEAAKGIGVTRQQLYRVINGECSITAEMAMRLEMAIGGSADAWLRMQMNYDLARIRARKSALSVKRLEPKVA